MNNNSVVPCEHTPRSFSEDKYIDLAGSNRLGVYLRDLAVSRWPEWVAKVATSPWLRNWQRSYLKDRIGYDPVGQLFIEHDVDVDALGCEISADDVAKCSAIAIAIFSSAVWGFGIDGWLRNAVDFWQPSPLSAKGPNVANLDKARGVKIRITPAMASILKFQGVTSPNSARTYFWENVEYRRHIVSLPCEYCSLDEWLESLYHKAMTSPQFNYFTL